jgi:hypothetical protein
MGVSKTVQNVLVEVSSKVTLTLVNPADAAQMLREVCEKGPQEKELTISGQVTQRWDDSKRDHWTFAMSTLLQPSQHLRSTGWARIKQLRLMVSWTQNSATCIFLSVALAAAS